MMKKRICYLLVLCLIIIFILLGINFYVKQSAKDRIIKDYTTLKDVDYILVLGAGIKNDKSSPILKDRLDKTIELYNNGVSDTLVLSGDGVKDSYDEVGVMSNYIMKNTNIENLYIDKSGISTYDSIYRLKTKLNPKKVVIVTQEYHLYRTLFIANKLGLDAYGVSAKNMNYKGKLYRETREVLARDKDYFKTIIKPESKYEKNKIIKK